MNLPTEKLYSLGRHKMFKRDESLVATTKLCSAERLKSPLNSEIGFSIFFVCHLQSFKYFLLNMMTNTVTPQLKNYEFRISAVCSRCKSIGTV